jgi:hypothetical protein
VKRIFSNCTAKDFVVRPFMDSMHGTTLVCVAAPYVTETKDLIEAVKRVSPRDCGDFFLWGCSFNILVVWSVRASNGAQIALGDEPVPRLGKLAALSKIGQRVATLGKHLSACLCNSSGRLRQAIEKSL